MWDELFLVLYLRPDSDNMLVFINAIMIHTNIILNNILTLIFIIIIYSESDLIRIVLGPRWLPCVVDPEGRGARRGRSQRGVPGPE